MNEPAPRGYILVLPPGWTRIPLRSGTEDAITAMVKRSSTGASAADLRERLSAATAPARASGGLDLYLPTDPVQGLILGASFVVAEVSFGAVEPLSPALLVAALCKPESAAPISVDGAVGVRTEFSASAAEPRGASVGSRRVDYLLPVPRDPDRWLLVAFSALDADDVDPEVTELLVELFDAIMLTFRWTTARPARPARHLAESSSRSSP